MDGYSSRHTRIPRLLDKSICLIERLMKVWIIVHISESVGICEESDSWRWDFFVGIEIPIIVVDIISSIVENISLVESKWENRSRESTIGTYLITILIEYNISLGVSMPEHIENIFLVIDSPVEETCNEWKSFSDILHPESPLSGWSHSSIDLSSLDKLCSSLFECRCILFEPIGWIRYTKWFKWKYILCCCSIRERILLVSFYSGSCFFVLIRDRLSNHIKSSCQCESTSWNSIDCFYSIDRNPRKWSEEKIGPLKIPTSCSDSISDSCRISHSSKTLKSRISMIESIGNIRKEWNAKYQKSKYAH